jgi:hypothetical protein
MQFHRSIRYQHGGNILFHKGLRYQKGAGFGSIFGALFRSLKPLVSMGFKAGKNLLQSNAAKSVGNTLLDIGKDAAKKVTVDLLEGKPFRESLSNEVDDAKKKIAAKLKGEGRKRKGRKRKTNFNSDDSSDEEIFKKKRYSLI